MKQILENPIMVSLELSIIQDLIKVIGQAVHNHFSHDDISAVLNTLKQRGQNAVDAHNQPKGDE